MNHSIDQSPRRNHWRAIVLALALAFGSLPGAAHALPPLSEDQHVTDSLVAAMVAEILRRGCPSIGARLFVALRKAKELEKYALSRGYSEKQIKAFITSPKEKARIIELAKAYLIENGVVENDKETYCRLGREEIAKRTLTGQLLWSWK